MRTLSATLLAAQRSASGEPYVSAVLRDAYGGFDRARFVRYYDGAEPDYYSAAVLAGDGSLIRARIDPSSHVLSTQRVAAPDDASDYSVWTSQGTVSASGAVALAALGDSVFLFFVHGDTLQVQVRQSDDNGATFGAAVTVATAASAVTYLAAAVAGSGDRVVFWTVGGEVWACRYASGAWQTPATWTPSMASISGLACTFLDDWAVVVTGTADTTGDAQVNAVIYGDGANWPADTWGTLRPVISAAAGSDVTYRAPAIDSVNDAWRLTFVEQYAGDVAYTRLQWSTMPLQEDINQTQWREPAAFDCPSASSGETGEYGVAITVSYGDVWLTSAAGVWHSPLPALADLDVSDDVLEAAVDVGEEDARVRLVLRNDSSASAGAAGRYAGVVQLAPGMQIDLAPGYRTAAGIETPPASSFWVESIEYLTGSNARVVVRARGGWWLLARWRARRQFAWALGDANVFQLLRFVSARAGLESAGSGASTMSGSVQPAFTIHPGESGKTALSRLLDLVPDRIRFDGAELLIHVLDPDEDAVYAYASAESAGGDDHTIVAGRYRLDGPSANRARVTGDGIFDEAFDFADAEAQGERTAEVVDLNVTTVEEASDRAAIILRDTVVHQRSDELQVFGLNCGQELYDVVTVTDESIGLDAARRRVLGLNWRYATGNRPRYDMTLLLGSP